MVITLFVLNSNNNKKIKNLNLLVIEGNNEYKKDYMKLERAREKLELRESIRIIYLASSSVLPESSASSFDYRLRNGNVSRSNCVAAARYGLGAGSTNPDTSVKLASLAGSFHSQLKEGILQYNYLGRSASLVSFDGSSQYRSREDIPLFSSAKSVGSLSWSSQAGGFVRQQQPVASSGSTSRVAETGLGSHDAKAGHVLNSVSTDVKINRHDCKVVRRKSRHSLGGSGKVGHGKGDAGKKRGLRGDGIIMDNGGGTVLGSLPVVCNKEGVSFVSDRSMQFNGNHEEESDIIRNNGRQ